MNNLASLKISISGVRGIVGQTLTPRLVASFAAAFGSYAGRGPILVGTDTRPSRRMVAQAVFAGLLGTGADVVDLGICPVPAIQFEVKRRRAFGGIAVTASHNPIEWNAMKFIGPEGLFLNQYRAEELLDIYHQGEFRRAADSEIGTVRADPGAFRDHREAILAFVDRELITKRRFRVAVDCVNGAGSVATVELLKALGCECIAVNTAMDEPFPHDPEPLAENLGELAAVARRERVDIAFAQDADADRLAVVSPARGAIGEEYSLAFAARQVLKRSPGPVVVNLSTSRMVEDAAAAAGATLLRTKVGEINVVEKLLAVNGSVGGEGNGGVIIPAIHPCRDSFAGMAVILQLLAEENRPLDDIVDSLPRYAIVKQKVGCPSDRVFSAVRRVVAACGSGAEQDRTDGVRLAWPDRWLQVRASNTEPILRVIAEAPDETAALALAAGAAREVRAAAGAAAE